MDVVIYHNPDCGTSRNALAIIKASGYTPTVIEYLKNVLPPGGTAFMDSVVNSNPQISVGSGIKPFLAALQTRLDSLPVVGPAAVAATDSTAATNLPVPSKPATQ